MNEAWIAVISALGGGAVVKILEVIFIPKKVQVDFATQLRDEIREDLNAYKEEVKGLRREVDYWRRMYFILIELLLKNKIDIPDDLLNPNPPPRTVPPKVEESLKKDAGES